jgi:hypothetical protein
LRYLQVDDIGDEDMKREIEFDMEPLAFIEHLKVEIRKLQNGMNDNNQVLGNISSNNNSVLVEENAIEIKSTKLKASTKRLASNSTNLEISIEPIARPVSKNKKTKPMNPKSSKVSKKKKFANSKQKKVLDIPSESESSDLETSDPLLTLDALEAEREMEAMSELDSLSTEDLVPVASRLHQVATAPVATLDKSLQMLCNGVVLEDDETLVGVIQNDALKHASTTSLNLGSIWREKHHFTYRFVEEVVSLFICIPFDCNCILTSRNHKKILSLRPIVLCLPLWKR